MTKAMLSLLNYGKRDCTWAKLSQGAQNVASEILAQRIAEATQDFATIKAFRDKRARYIYVDIPTASECYHLNVRAMKKGNLSGRL